MRERRTRVLLVAKRCIDLLDFRTSVAYIFSKENLQREVELVASAVNSSRGRIVQSPERIKKHISEMAILAQDERMHIAAAEAKQRELKTKLDALNVFEQVRRFKGFV